MKEGIELAQKGRPRNVKLQQSILAVAYELLLECGYEAVTVEKIAKQAGVSKATIYKWWPNKAAVVADGFFEAAANQMPIPDTGSVMEDIRIHASNLALFMESKEGNIITELIGQGQMDESLMQIYREYYVKPRRMESAMILTRGISRGELSHELDVNSSIDLIYGPLFYRLLVSGELFTADKINGLIWMAFNGLRNFGSGESKTVTEIRNLESEEKK
ncbi:TetR/AcrR family transcriptional regulator [Paenibacillus sp. CF384]|uniref:TetR/AcrR family transcriptional regulator n=1 Tax=Paenibacillus sp. CF384 TaxID=1884382 RepID=UPI00089BCB71|nr:TetR/AcrR family transcriptional regulator [Paenibacillus sp. CF384]SDW11916.1 transcriptional regulator, TetR family [Paenibacillus sp. CF384]